jgi:hypothetical protein
MVKMAKESLRPTHPISKANKYKAELHFDLENFNVETIEKRKQLQKNRLTFW